MPLYTIKALPLPFGYIAGAPNKINQQGAATGWCSKLGPASDTYEAVLWPPNPGAPELLNLPQAMSSEGKSLDSNMNVVGTYLGPDVHRPFYWNKIGSQMTLLKDLSAVSAAGGAWDINDKGQVCGNFFDGDGVDPNQNASVGAFWENLGDIPKALDLGYDQWGCVCKAINENTLVAADSSGDYIDSNNASAMWNPATPSIQNIRPAGSSPSMTCGINDIDGTPQIVGNYMTGIPEQHAYIYNSLTNDFADIGLPGEISSANAINNNADIVGFANDEAVLWTLGQRVSLNNPIITNAQERDLTLSAANSINDKGEIVGVGHRISNPALTIPWIAIPNVPIVKLPNINRPPPYFIWPGDPFRFLKSLLKGTSKGGDLLHALLISEIASSISDSKSRVEIRNILGRLIDQELQKLRAAD